ncbi:MAG: hypothetical protein K6B69_02015 [Lachnospiraceae bacterium]|nr:hypothetical protein [Lachnospiraceae bacterium]
MNKDNIIADFKAQGGGFETAGYFYDVHYVVSNVVCSDQSLLPYSDQNRERRTELSEEELELLLGNWLSGRCAANHNFRVASFYRLFKIDQVDRFIHKTHAASLNDTFWVKAEDEDIIWPAVSLYRKRRYDPSITRFCMGDNIVWLPGTEPHFDSAPELTTNGSFRRGFIKDGEDIFFYKRNSSTGLEIYSEVLASEVAQKITSECSVEYSLEKKYRKIHSKCRFFTDEKTGLVPYYCFWTGRSTDIKDALEFFSEIGSETSFRKMMVIDSLIFNVDRHLNNFGVLIDNDTLAIKGMAPIYDLNLSLFGDDKKQTFEDIYSCVSSHHPSFGGDFVRLGHQMLTEELRTAVSEMQDFTFRFRGNDEFEEWRVKKLEEIIRKQAKAILAEEDHTTRQVFQGCTSEKTRQEEKKYGLIRLNAAFFTTEFEEYTQYSEYRSYNVSVMEDPEQKIVEVYIDNPDNTGTITLDFIGRSVSQKGKQFPEDLVDRICGIFEKYK